MRYSFVAIWATLHTGVLAAPALGSPVELQERAVPTACAKPPAVSLAYNILSVLHASPFCTQWLGIVTKTVSATVDIPVTVSQTASVTSTAIELTTASSTTVVDTTTTVSNTVTAPTVTSTVSASTTVFSSGTTTTTLVITSTLTSTTFLYDVEAKRKLKRAKPTKLAQLRAVADTIVSSACSCLATTPTVTATASRSVTSVVQVVNTVLTTQVSIAATVTETTFNVVTEVSTVTETPSTSITFVVTLTSPTIVATQTATRTQTFVSLAIIDVIIIPIELDGCTVGTNFARFNNIGGATFEAAGQLCAARCVAAGKTNCDDFFTQQNLPGGTWDCFLLRVQDEVNTNFFCNNPNIGRAAEWIIIY